MIKNFILDIIDNMRERLENDECTEDELNSMYNVAKQHLVSYTTINDAAKRFNKNNRLIHDAIGRNRYGNKLRPIRKVYYNFIELLDAIPRTWSKK